MAVRPLIYNLHRLIARCPSKTPTGVDRVDFQHACFLLTLAEQEQRKIIFIRQQGSVARLVPHQQASTIIDNLDKRWQQGLDLPPAIKPSKFTWLFHWPATSLQQRKQQYISPCIIREVEASRLPPIYLHSGHGTIHHFELHQQLKTRLRTDSVFYLHDLIPIDFPEYTNNPQALKIHQRRLKTMACTGSLILANSEDSRQRFLTYCQRHGLPQPRTEVLLIGVEEHMIAASKKPRTSIPERFQHLTKPFFITIGTIEPRKNHLLLLHIWRELAVELGEGCPKLVILGKRGWKNENIVHLLERCPAIIEHVVEINDASDQEMITLLQHAKALLFPSFAEGWGMPLAEALTLGTPAISADIPALRESGQELAAYLDPLDGSGWKQAILRYLNHNDDRPAAKEFQPARWLEHLNGLHQRLQELDANR